MSILSRWRDICYHSHTSSTLHTQHIQGTKYILLIYIWPSLLFLFHMGMCMHLKIILHHNHVFIHEFNDYLLSFFCGPTPWWGTGVHPQGDVHDPSSQGLWTAAHGPSLSGYLKLADMERGCSPFSVWAKLCSSFLPSNLRDNSILLIGHRSGKSNIYSLELHGLLCHKWCGNLGAYIDKCKSKLLQKLLKSKAHLVPARMARADVLHITQFPK